MMAAKDYFLNKGFLLFVQRTSVIVILGAFLAKHPDNTTAWCAVGAVVADLFHAAKDGNGNGHANGNGGK